MMEKPRWNRAWRAWLALLLTPWACGCGSKSLEEAVEAAKKSVESAQKSVQSAQKTASEAAKNTAVEAAQKTLDSAKQSLPQTLPQALPAALGSGGELALDAPLKFSSLSARLVPGEGKRPALLQIASSFDPASETFPAVLIQLEDAGTPAELAGKTLPAQVFAAASDQEGVWRNPPGKPVQLKIVAASASSVTCELTGAELERVDQPGMVMASGSLTAALTQETAP